jgi:hypothetical protein
VTIICEAGWARPARRRVASTGTRSRIFSFNQISLEGGLIKPENYAKGTAQNLPKIASNLPQADYPLAPFLGAL